MNSFLLSSLMNCTPDFNRTMFYENSSTLSKLCDRMLAMSVRLSALDLDTIDFADVIRGRPARGSTPFPMSLRKI